jgi:hypothetical protein
VACWLPPPPFFSVVVVVVVAAVVAVAVFKGCPLTNGSHR